MQILTTISRGAGTLFPILLVVSIGIELYERYQKYQETNHQTEPSAPDTEELVTDNG